MHCREGRRLPLKLSMKPLNIVLEPMADHGSMLRLSGVDVVPGDTGLACLLPGSLDVSRFGAAPLSAYHATREMNYGNRQN